MRMEIAVEVLQRLDDPVENVQNPIRSDRGMLVVVLTVCLLSD